MDSATTTLDTLLDGRVRLAQPRTGYRAAVDPVLLAAAVPAAPGQHVADLGMGVGAAALCLAWRVPELRVTGIELQPTLADLARRNVADNGFAGRVSVVEGDIRTPPAGPFDFAMANPPYLKAGGHSASPHAGKALADGERDTVLADWIGAAARVLKPRGWLVMIHRADRFDELVAALRPRFGSLSLLPVAPRAGSAAGRVIVAARLGGRSPARLLPPLALHEADGTYTEAAEAVLRQGQPLGSLAPRREP